MTPFISKLSAICIKKKLIEPEDVPWFEYGVETRIATAISMIPFTLLAVRLVYLQEQLGFVGNNVDGIVGYNTWAAIARSLRLYPFKDSNPECGSIRRPMGVPNERVYMWENFTGIWNFEYFLENNFDTDPI